MKRFVAMFVVLVCLLVSGSVRAADKELAGKSQLQLTVNHLFWENNNVSGYASGIFLLDLNTGLPIIFGYAGPRFQISDNLNLYTLGVTMNTPLGWSVGPSVWVDYSRGKHFGLVEYDHYEPFLSTVHDDLLPLPKQSYYGYAEYNYALPDKVKLGVAFETFGFYEEDKAQEMMYGPFIQWNRFRILLGYDETPLVPGNNFLVLRGKISI